MDAPVSPPGDDKDWTWVAEQPCPDCGFDPGMPPEQLSVRIAAAAAGWLRVLQRPELGRRPAPRVWSPLEYACHVRDVLAVFTERAWLIRREDDPEFANWDQDAAAVEQRYWEADPATVARQIGAATGPAAAAFVGVPEGGWQRRGLRSNGAQFTLESLGRYFLHDVEHHLWDVRQEPA